MWTVQNLLLIFGLILIASAIFGGGLTIRGIIIPEISPLLRMLAALGGIGFVVVALNYETQPPLNRAAAETSTSSTTDNGANAPRLPTIITDRLGYRQTYARLSVYIDGRRVGGMEMTRESPSGRVEIEPTNRSAYYSLEGVETTRLGEETVQRRLTGVGSIELVPGSRFCVKSPEPRGGSDRSRSVVTLAPIREC